MYISTPEMVVNTFFWGEEKIHEDLFLMNNSIDLFFVQLRRILGASLCLKISKMGSKTSFKTGLFNAYKIL